eukprot:scaffold42966_cov56-Attheya_sp.AAC.2
MDIVPERGSSLGNGADEESPTKNSIKMDYMMMSPHGESLLPLTDHEDSGSSNKKWWKKHSLSSNQVMAMVSNFSTSYNAVSVSQALPILAFGKSHQEEQDSICSSALLAGMVVGQVLGGTLGDVAGRTRALYGVMALQIFASLGSATCFGNIYTQLAAWRFLLGIGAGGVYPLAAVLTAESDSTKSEPRHQTQIRREHEEPSSLLTHDEDTFHDDLHEDFLEDKDMNKLRMLALTFSTQGVGFLCVPLVTYILLIVLGPNKLDLVWRLVLGLGSVPGLVLLCMRWRQHRHQPRQQYENVQSTPQEEDRNGGIPQHQSINETTIRDPQQSTHDMDSTGKGINSAGDENWDDNAVSDPVVSLEEASGVTGEENEGATGGLWESIRSEPNLTRKLLGTAGTWFFFDVLFYGNTLFEPIVLQAAFGTSSSNDDENDTELLIQTAWDGLILSLIALPGYFTSIALIGRVTCGGIVEQSPRYIQMQGFACMGILYAIIGTYWSELRRIQWLLVLLYGLTFYFANYGPNTTTFMLPSVTYSPSCRSTLNGISAAAGKAGALLGASMFEPAATNFGDDKVMLMCATVSILGLIMTRFCVITPHK